MLVLQRPPRLPGADSPIRLRWESEDSRRLLLPAAGCRIPPQVLASDDNGEDTDEEDEDDDLVEVPLPEPTIEDDEEFDENDFDDDFDEDFEDEPDEDLLEFERELEGDPLESTDTDDEEFDDDAEF